MDSPCLVRPSPLSVDELGSQIVALSGRIAAASCRWLLLVAEFDARDGCSRFGLATTSHWLAHACGLAQRTAVEHVRVARALAAHPQLADEMTAGRLSYSQVRAISRAAEPGETALVDDLVQAAEHATGQQLESLVRGLRTVRDADLPARPEEYVRSTWTQQSQRRISARLDPERGALVDSAIAAVANSEGLSAADALVRLAEIGLAALAETGVVRELRGDERAAIVVHLDADRIPADDEPAADERPRSAERGSGRARPRARLSGGPGLPDRVVERLLCEGRIRTVVHDHDDRSNVLHLGRSHRVVSDRQFRALLIRDGGRCNHPGCPARRHLEAHHVRHWLHGGRTDLDNLVLLCGCHHRQHHEGAFTIVPIGRGRFRFIRADGQELLRHVDPSRFISTGLPVDQEHADVADTAATPKWDGSRLDRDWAVAGLAQQLGRVGPRRERSAERPDYDPWAPTQPSPGSQTA